MERYTKFLMKHKKMIIVLFFAAAAVSSFFSLFVGVNYNFADYLPDGTASTIALDVMKEEYQQAVPNMRVLLYDVTIPEALDYKERIRAVDGVEEVQWLDDAVNIYEPLEMVPAKTIEDWYKDGDALFSVTVDEEKETDAVDAVREIIGDENSMSGDAVTNALAPRNTSKDIQKIMLFVVPLVIAVLMLTTESWFEPVLFMVTIGVAILLNQGTNLIFGTVSFVTNAAGSVLQLAVSMDYSIFLLHRFAEKRQEYENIEDAMTEAVKASVGSILSSGLTTVTGFLALVLMRFKIGLIDGTKELEDGTSQFKTETEDIDDRVDEEIDRMISEFSGDEYEPVSFVSDRNANVKLVQFVMTTSPIEAQKEETEQVVQKEETIWDRVKNLFE